MIANDFKLLQKAESLTEIERWQEAVPLLLQTLAHDPQNYHATCLLSLCYFHLDDNDSALEYAQKGISIEPEDEWAHRLRSIVLGNLGKKKESLKSAEEAVRLAPFEAQTLQTLIFSYLDSNQPRKAKEIAEQMRESHPESDSTFLALGVVYLQSNNPFEAEKCFREALRQNPNNSNARNNLGVAILSQERLKPMVNRNDSVSIFGSSTENEIVEHFTAAIKLEPNNKQVVESIKHQFSYTPYFFSAIAFVPMLLMFFLVAPALATFAGVLGVISFSNLFWETFKRRRNATPELKMFLKSNNNFALTAHFAEMRRILRFLIGSNWQPHLLALSAVILNFLGSFQLTLGLYQIMPMLPSILIIISCVWLAIRITRA